MRFLVLAVGLSFAVVASAQSRSPAELGAEQLSAQARADWKAGRYDDAIANFRAAEKLFPAGKYAFNVAFALAQRKRPLEAWAALERAEKLGMEARYAPRVERLRASLSKAILVDHAKIEVTVTPSSARVVRNGAVWSAPRRLWTKDSSSRIEVSAPGYETFESVWTHRPGAAHTLPVVLREKRPDPIESDLKPEPVTTPVPKAEPAPKARPDVMPVVIEGPDTDETSALTVSKWACLGAGVAALGTGAALLAMANGVNADLDALNADPAGQNYGPTEFDRYETDFNEDAKRRDTLRSSGLVAVGVGGALAAAAVVLFVLDGPADTSEPGVSIAPALFSSGVGAHVRF